MEHSGNYLGGAGANGMGMPDKQGQRPALMIESHSVAGNEGGMSLSQHYSDEVHNACGHQ